MATIYKIENPKGDVYIGSTGRDNIGGRIAEHKYALKKGRKGKIYKSFSLYGFENHKFIEVCKVDKESLFELEHFIIQEFEPNLNEVTKYNATATGKMWITNGDVETQVKKGSNIPNGFKKGRKENKKLGRKPYKD